LSNVEEKKCYGFGPTFRKWIKYFYTYISSIAIKNCHLSYFFLLERVRQDDLISTYLFILVLELLRGALENKYQVPGVTINGSEYILSHYADDYVLILGNYHNSLEQALNIFIRLLLWLCWTANKPRYN